MSLHAGEGAAWGLPLKGKCKAVELAAYWPCLRAYLERRANETARVVVVSTAGRADLPGADGAPVPDVAYLADRPPPPCVSCVLLVFVSSSFCRGAEPTEPMFETGPRRRHRRGTPSMRGLMTQRPRETYYRITRIDAIKPVNVVHAGGRRRGRTRTSMRSRAIWT